MQQLANDKLAYVYDIRDIAQEYNVDFSEYKAMQSVDYLRSKIAEIEAEANQDLHLADDSFLMRPTVTVNNDGIVNVIDKETGEILYTYGMD